MKKQTRFETLDEFKPIHLKMPTGTIYWRVNTYNDSGRCVGREYTTDEEDLDDMMKVASGYYTDTSRIKRK